MLMQLLMLILMVRGHFFLTLEDLELTIIGMGEISGLYFAKNIFFGGDVVLGSLYRPDYQNVFLSNQLVSSNLHVGKDQPGQFQVCFFNQCFTMV